MGPQRPHRLEVFAQHGAAASGWHTMIDELVGVPAEPDPDADPAVRQMIQRRNAFRQRDRIMLDRQRHRGGKPDPRRHRRCCSQAHPRVQRAHIAVVRQRSVTRRRMGRLALDRDVGVFGHVKRAKPVAFSKSGGRGRGDAAVAGEQHKSVVHAPN